MATVTFYNIHSDYDTLKEGKASPHVFISAGCHLEFSILFQIRLNRISKGTGRAYKKS